MSHEELVQKNRLAWEAQSYQAWVEGYGTPEQAALTLLQDPKHKLKKILPHLPQIEGLSIANPLGSHGRVAVSLALMGADVTVIDISSSNKRYALELAEAASVDINYELADFVKYTDENKNPFDHVIMELGILHHFFDLDQFVKAVHGITKQAGTVILNDFHPLLKKSISLENGGINLVGDYFSSEVTEADTPYAVFLNDECVPKCLVRRRTMGEIVSSFAQNGFRLNKLIEVPSNQQINLPGTFTLVATAE